MYPICNTFQTEMSKRFGFTLILFKIFSFFYEKIMVIDKKA